MQIATEPTQDIESYRWGGVLTSLCEPEANILEPISLTRQTLLILTICTLNADHNKSQLTISA